MRHPRSGQINGLEKYSGLLHFPSFIHKRMLPFKQQKKSFYSFMGRKKTSIPEDDNELLAQISQKIFMLSDLQHAAKFNSYSIK